MRSIIAILFLLVTPSASWIARPAHVSRSRRAPSTFAQRPYMSGGAPRITPPENDDGDRQMSERESLYASPDFELDAFTITALLGVAIAFQFFVLGNM